MPGIRSLFYRCLGSRIYALENLCVRMWTVRLLRRCLKGFIRRIDDMGASTRHTGTVFDSAYVCAHCQQAHSCVCWTSFAGLYQWNQPAICVLAAKCRCCYAYMLGCVLKPQKVDNAAIDNANKKNQQHTYQLDPVGERRLECLCRRDSTLKTRLFGRPL